MKSVRLPGIRQFFGAALSACLPRQQQITPSICGGRNDTPVQVVPQSIIIRRSIAGISRGTPGGGGGAAAAKSMMSLNRSGIFPSAFFAASQQNPLVVSYKYTSRRFQSSSSSGGEAEKFESFELAVCSRHKKKRATNFMMYDAENDTWACTDGPGQCKGKGMEHPCHNCNQMGHFARDCPEPRTTALPKCRLCGKEGHIGRNCNLNMTHVDEEDIVAKKMEGRGRKKGHLVRERCSLHGKLRGTDHLVYDEQAESWRCDPRTPCKDGYQSFADDKSGGDSSGGGKRNRAECARHGKMRLTRAMEFNSDDQTWSCVKGSPDECKGRWE